MDKSYSTKTPTMSSRIERMREHHSSEIEEIEKRLRILRLRSRYSVKRDRSNKTIDTIESIKQSVNERYQSPTAKHIHYLRALPKRQPRSLELKGGILDTGLCALPYHGFAERLFGLESEDEEFFFSDDDNSIFDEDRSDEDNEILSFVSPHSSSRDRARLSQTKRRNIAPTEPDKIRDVVSTEKHSFRDLRPVPLTLVRDLSASSSVPAIDVPPTSTFTNSAHLNTKVQAQPALSVKSSETKKTWLNRLKCQSHAEKDDFWVSKDILKAYDGDHLNVRNEGKVAASNVLQSSAVWNQDDSSTIATHPSFEKKQHRSFRHANQTRVVSQTSSYASQPPLSADDVSFENLIPIPRPRTKSNRSVSTGRIRSSRESTGSGTRVGVMSNQGTPRVGTGHSRKSNGVPKTRSKTKKTSKPLNIDLRLSASDDSADPYETVHFFQTGFRPAGTGAGTITSSWW